MKTRTIIIRINVLRDVESRGAWPAEEAETLLSPGPGAETSLPLACLHPDSKGAALSAPLQKCSPDCPLVPDTLETPQNQLGWRTCGRLPEGVWTRDAVGGHHGACRGC